MYCSFYVDGCNGAIKTRVESGDGNYWDVKLDLHYYGDPVLREKAEPVEEITEEIRRLCRDMIETMLAYNGIGLAATQVGHMLRIFVSNVDYEDEVGEVRLCDPIVYINPVLFNPGDDIVERNEGCLSIPRLYAAVARPLSITFEALDIDGNEFTNECYGYLARNIMHENDHLNGVLFVDRIKGKRRTLLESELHLIKQHYYRKWQVPLLFFCGVNHHQQIAYRKSRIF
jgi:peptide deformylase